MVETLRRTALVLGVAAAAACSSVLGPDAGSGVRFAVDREAYAPGDTVHARLENRAEVALGYNLCFSTLEQRRDAEWIARDEPLMICTADLERLDPGESVEHRRELPAGLERGRYRLRVWVHFPLDGGSRLPVRSEAFAVEP